MKKTNLTKRIMATAMGLVMVIGLLPLSAAVAAENASVVVEAICESYSGTVIGGGSYTAGDTVTLIATPIEDMQFMYWLDATVELGDEPTEEELEAAIVSFDAEYTFTATENVTIEAVFSVAPEIPIVPMQIIGVGADRRIEEIDVDGDFDTLIIGAEQITLPGDVIEEITTIGDKQYEVVGLVLFGYDETTDSVTTELIESLVIDEMPLYGSAEFWNWFTPISDGIYVAYTEYTPDDDEDDNDPQTPGGPGAPTDPQEPTDPKVPNDSPISKSPLTGENSHIALWTALLFISSGLIITLIVVDRKRSIADRY